MKGNGNAMTIYENRKHKNHYKLFTVTQIGALYGTDDKSPFVCTMCYDNRNRFGKGATLLMYRYDMEGKREWYQVWESSDTTKALIEKAFAINKERKERNGRMIRFRGVTRYTKTNSLSEIHNHKNTVVFK